MYTLIYTQSSKVQIHIYNCTTFESIFFTNLQHIQSPIKVERNLIYFECFLDKKKSSIINVTSTYKSKFIKYKVQSRMSLQIQNT